MKQLVWNLPKKTVSLNVLKRACQDVSMTAHRFWIERETDHRVTVAYSNPDEYGNDRVMLAQLPCYRVGSDVIVVVDIVRMYRDSEAGDGWQYFEVLWDALDKAADAICRENLAELPTEGT